MSNFAEDIEKEAGSHIIGIVIGEMGWPDYNEEGKKIENESKNTFLDWAHARPLLNYEYDTGFGAPECHSIVAWTATHVVFVAQYDGSTAIHKFPRNPEDCEPYMPGG